MMWDNVHTLIIGGSFKNNCILYILKNLYYSAIKYQIYLNTLQPKQT